MVKRRRVFRGCRLFPKEFRHLAATFRAQPQGSERLLMKMLRWLAAAGFSLFLIDCSKSEPPAPPATEAPAAAASPAATPSAAPAAAPVPEPTGPALKVAYSD